MVGLRSAASRLLAGLRRRRLDDDQRHELEMHLELLTAKHIRAGLTAGEARRAARRQLGNATLVREEIYLMHGAPRVESLLQDFRQAIRLLTTRPGFALVAIATLSIGIGAPTAVFSVVNAVLLRPLAYPAPDQLVRFELRTSGPAGAIALDALPASAARAWSEHTTTLSGLALYNERALTLSSADGPFRLTGVATTPNLFDVLDVTPALGRTFEDNDRDPRQIVLSHASWTRFFAANPSLVGPRSSWTATPTEWPA